MKIRNSEDVAAAPVDVAGAKDVRIRLLIHRHENAPNFYMRQFIVAPGGHTPRHSHDWEHEVFILSGAGTAFSSEGEKPFAAGDAIYVPPNEEHQFRNTREQELKFLCLIPTTGK